MPKVNAGAGLINLLSAVPGAFDEFLRQISFADPEPRHPLDEGLLFFYGNVEYSHRDHGITKNTNLSIGCRSRRSGRLCGAQRQHQSRTHTNTSTKRSHISYVTTPSIGD